VVARYHHGDLRQAVLEASLRLIAEQGIESLSLREVARRAGVTHQAPYHHFADKGALLDALAEEGFGVLRDAMQAARAGLRDPAERLAACGKAYIEFALGHPAYFQVMFRPGRESKPIRGPAADQAYGVLVDAVRELRRAAGARGDPEAETVTLAWSAVHGFASLWLDGASRMSRSRARAAGAGTATLLARLLTDASPRKAK
jgi:AcrR family transcriptional regulator